MTSLASDHRNLLDLPFEIRLQVYENALENRPEILACSCANSIKTQPFLGECTRFVDLRSFVLDMPFAITANRQTYLESSSLTRLGESCNPSLIVGGTNCFKTLLKHLPDQHPQDIKVILRLTVRSSWMHKTNEPDYMLAAFDSLVGSLGIGTGKAYTVTTKEVRVLPDYVAEGLELLQAELHLSMRCESKGWLALSDTDARSTRVVSAT